MREGNVFTGVLQAATKLGQGNIFTSACPSPGQTHTLPPGQTPPKRGISGPMFFLVGWVSLVPGPLREGICPGGRGGGIFQGGEYGERESGLFSLIFVAAQCGD